MTTPRPILAAVTAVASAALPCIAQISGLNDTIEFSIITGRTAGFFPDQTYIDPYNLTVNVTLNDGVGNATFSGDSALPISGGTINVTVSPVNFTTRLFSFSIVSDDPVNGFINDTTQVASGPVGYIGYRFGALSTDSLGNTQDPFTDPTFTELLPAPNPTIASGVSTGGFPEVVGSSLSASLVWIVADNSQQPPPVVNGTVWLYGIREFNASFAYGFNCIADINGDAVLDNGDISTFVQLFLRQSLAADINGDDILDNGDIGAFVAAFLAGC